MEEPAKDYPNPSQIRDNVNARLSGAIRKLKKGYGFIAGDDGKDYFFHWSAMEKTTKNFRDLELQDRVTFLIVESPQGVRAIQVRVVIN